MRHTGLLLTLAIFIFWGTMNTLVVQRQRELATLDKYRAGFKNFIGPEMLRERWMSIYRKNKKIGYTGYRFEKVYALEGVEVLSSLESKVKFEFMNQERWIELNGTLVADEEMRPMTLRLDVTVEGVGAATLRGERDDERFVLSLEGGGLSLPATALPLEEMHLGDALAPTLPVAGMRVGDEFDMPCFDPLMLGRGVAHVVVTSKETRQIDGLPVDAYCLETTFRNVSSKSWVTEAGELLAQELGPPLDDIILRRDKAKFAKRINKR